jgi:hypothetical protein
VASVTQCDLTDVPHSQAVDECVPRFDLVDDARGAACELDDGAVLGEDDPVARKPALACEPALRGEHPELSVNGHEIARAEKSVDRPDLLGVSVP